MDWKSTRKLDVQSNVFDDVRNKFVSAHFIVTTNVLTVPDEKTTNDVLPRSYQQGGGGGLRSTYNFPKSCSGKVHVINILALSSPFEENTFFLTFHTIRMW